VKSWVSSTPALVRRRSPSKARPSWCRRVRHEFSCCTTPPTAWIRPDVSKGAFTLAKAPPARRYSNDRPQLRISSFPRPIPNAEWWVKLRESGQCPPGLCSRTCHVRGKDWSLRRFTRTVKRKTLLRVKWDFNCSRDTTGGRRFPLPKGNAPIDIAHYDKIGEQSVQSDPRESDSMGVRRPGMRCSRLPGALTIETHEDTANMFVSRPSLLKARSGCRGNRLCRQ